MAHVRIVETESGFLTVEGVQDAPGATISPEKGREVGQEQFGAPEDNSAPLEGKDAEEEVLQVSEEEDTPPQQPKDEEDSGSFVCEECAKVCSSKAGLAAHVRAKHKE